MTRFGAVLATTATIAGAAMLNACGAQAPPLTYDDFTIGGVPEGVDSTEIRLTFGDPDSVSTAENPFSADEPFVVWHYPEFEVRYGDGDVPIGYMILSPGERTPRGLSVGDPTRLARQLYGDPTVHLGSSWTYVDPRRDAGLYVIDLLVHSDTVRRIYIGRALD